MAFESAGSRGFFKAVENEFFAVYFNLMSSCILLSPGLRRQHIVKRVVVAQME